MSVREATVIINAADARRLGRYVIVGEVAEGGMGRIYLARISGHGGFEKPVALKVMHQHLAERSELAEMFLDEARVTSLIRHPNVCAVHDFGEAQGVSFLVMEYMVGQTLLEVLRRLHVHQQERERPMFWAIVARVVAEACEGLHAAHSAVDERGRPMHVVHRDISPENVFVTYDGAVKVFDFGVARAVGQRHQTVVGTFKGKFAYASPEAFSAEAVDLRTDLWSMGVALWETLAGAPLFYRRSDAETMGAIFRDAIPTVGSVRPGCPPELEQVVQKALERDVSRRYASAREMARDLNRFAVRSGEHVGTAEIGEWIRRLFAEEHRAAMEASRAVARLGGAVDTAPALSVDSLPNLPSHVRPLEDLHAQPTLIHPIVSDDDDEPTVVADSMLLSPLQSPGSKLSTVVFESPASQVQGHPSPFDPSAPQERGVTGSRERGVPSPFEAPTSPTGGRARKVLVTILKVAGVFVVLGLAIFFADMAAQPPAPAYRVVEPVAPPPVEEPAPVEAPAPPSEEGEGEGHVDVAGATGEAATPTSGEPTAAPVGDADDDATSANSVDQDATPTDAIERHTTARDTTARDTAQSTSMHRAVRDRPRASSEPRTSRELGTPSAEPGTVSVAAIGGWADIFEGNTRLGRTPARITLSAGRHTLTLRPPEGAERRETVRVPAGGEARVRVDLSR